MHVWNSTFKKTGSEAKAFMSANSILKKRLKNKEALNKDGHHNVMMMKVDEYLGNLRG